MLVTKFRTVVRAFHIGKDGQPDYSQMVDLFLSDILETEEKAKTFIEDSIVRIETEEGLKGGFVFADAEIKNVYVKG